MARLPTPGGDNGTWGTLLNDFLLQAHTASGGLKSGVVAADNIADGTVTNAKITDGTIASTKLDSAVQASLTMANNSLQATNNLSELSSTAATARTNLGLGTAATMTPATLAANSAFTSAYAPFVEPVNVIASSGAAQTIPNPSTYGVNLITLTANCIFTFPTATAGTSFALVLVQDATGSRTVTWPAAAKWAYAIAPTLTTTAAARDYFTFVCVDGATWAGFAAGMDVR